MGMLVRVKTVVPTAGIRNDFKTVPKSWSRMALKLLSQLVAQGRFLHFLELMHCSYWPHAIHVTLKD